MFEQNFFKQRTK